MVAKWSQEMNIDTNIYVNSSNKKGIRIKCKQLVPNSVFFPHESGQTPKELDVLTTYFYI